MFKIAQPAVNELRRGRRRTPRQIPTFQQDDFRASASGVACDARAVNATADNGQIIDYLLHKNAHANAAAVTKAVTVASITGSSALHP